MAYADYNFYVNEFCGKAIKSEDEFNFYAGVGADYISAYTADKATSDNNKVKRCNCRIADILQYNNQSLDGKQKASEKVGDISVTYENATKGAVEKQIDNAIKLYLLPTGLLYRGL